MKPKYETTGRSLGSASAAFAASSSPGRKRSRSTEFGTTVESTPKTPATPAVGRGPDVREAGDGAGVHLRAGLAEELRRGARRAVDVRLELRRVELADQVREAGRSAAELAAVVDVEDGSAR